MLSNRSIPNGPVIPELPYPNVREAADWLSRAFGFSIRVLIADHRVQINACGGAVVLVQGDSANGCRVLVRVEDVDAHHARALAAGAHVLQAPATHPYGERQYSVRDCGGHAWTFSQSVADVAPEEWGGTTVEVGPV